MTRGVPNVVGPGSAALLLLLLGATVACGPESAVDALRDNVRSVCKLTLGPCNGEPPLGPEGEDLLASCVEARADDLGEEIREELGETCYRKYAEAYACAATWTCEDFHNREQSACVGINDEFEVECGFSPLIDRDDK